MEKYTIEQIKNYILSQDSLGDVMYNLNDASIRLANDIHMVLEKEFERSELDETEKIQLDNLDWAKLVNKNGQIYVENEHGSTFDISELSELEVGQFKLQL